MVLIFALALLPLIAVVVMLVMVLREKEVAAGDAEPTEISSAEVGQVAEQ